MERPFQRKGIDELETIFCQAGDKLETLSALADELKHRTVPRAVALAQRVGQHLQELTASTVQPEPIVEPEGESEQDFLETSGGGTDSVDLDEPLWEAVDGGREPDVSGAENLNRSTYIHSSGDPFPREREEPNDLEEGPVTGSMPPELPEGPERARSAPETILEMWTALEVLSPQTYVKPADLADGDGRRVAQFGERRPLPWANGSESSRRNYKLYYQVVLGAIDMEVAAPVLLKAFGDKRPERPSTRGYAALAAVTIDKAGRPVEEGAVAVSSFGWGYGLARTGQLAELKRWPVVERELIKGLEQRLRREKDGEILPLVRPTIDEAFEWLCDQIKLPSAERIAPFFALRIYRWFQASGDPDPMLLNSFFLEDLSRARALQGRKATPRALKQYLGIERPTKIIDLLENKQALETLLAPGCTPAARWPIPDGHPLVLLQQSAVNAAFEHLQAAPGIFAINGPPGTGKTTLLRDLVAGVILERARALAVFDDPAAAFKHDARSRRGQGFVHLYELAASLRGFELLVASSNNRAVENVSRELPGVDQIELSQIPDYFSSIAGAVAGEGRDAWGLIAGVLGNAENRVAFRKTFWADRDRGMQTYLWVAAGNEAMIDVVDPETGDTITRPARVVTDEKPPQDKTDALRRWERARSKFRRALDEAENALREMEVVRQQLKERARLRKERPQLEQSCRAAQVLVAEAKEALNQATKSALACSQALAELERLSTLR